MKILILYIIICVWVLFLTPKHISISEKIKTAFIPGLNLIIFFILIIRIILKKIDEA